MNLQLPVNKTSHENNTVERQFPWNFPNMKVTWCCTSKADWSVTDSRAREQLRSLRGGMRVWITWSVLHSRTSCRPRSKRRTKVGGYSLPRGSLSTLDHPLFPIRRCAAPMRSRTCDQHSRNTAKSFASSWTGDKHERCGHTESVPESELIFSISLGLLQMPRGLTITSTQLNSDFCIRERERETVTRNCFPQEKKLR